MPGLTGHRRLLSVAILIGALVLAACGGSSDSEPTTASGNTGDPGSTPAPSDTAPGSSDLDGPIVFADFGWDSAYFHNRVAQFILEHGYGYETTSVPGETVPLTQGMIRGDVHVATEFWADQNPPFLEAVEEGTILDLGTNYGESVQGFYVPTYVIEGDPERGIEPMAPDLKSVEDLPKYKDLFQDPEDPSKGRFYDCIAGWECEQVNAAKFAAYGLDEHYNRFLPGSATALASSLVAAYEKGEPWFGYYWGPTWIFGLLDLTKIEEPPYSDECWEHILEGKEACAYPDVQVRIGVNAEFAEKAPDVVEFLENYETTFDQTSAALLYMHDNEAEPEEAAIWFLKEYEEQWTQWVPEDVAAKVRDALASS